MRFEDLEVFRALHETGSFHRAALRSGLTPSAVTKVVRKLEEEFGLQLVERGSRAMALTPAGRTLYQRAVEVGALADATRKDMVGEATSLRGTLRLGVVPALLNSVVTPVLSDMLASSTSVRLLLSVKHSGDLVRMVQEAKLDLALGFGIQNPSADIACLRVARQRYKLLVRNGHPLDGPSPSLAKLSTVRWLLPTADVAIRGDIERMFADAGLDRPNVQVETDASATLLFSLVRRTDLVAVMAEQAFLPLDAEGLKILDIDGGALEGIVALYHRRNTPAAGMFTSLRDRLVAQARANFRR
jgi:DNA-binding transcriptional LysR family regulator